MEVLRCLLVDDDAVSRRIIAQYIKQTEGTELVAECASSAETLRMLQEEDVDVLLLDVEMSGMSGLDLLKAMDHTPHCIFITSTRDYAVEAFNYNAVDFLLKPFDYPRFAKAITRARERLWPSGSRQDDHQHDILTDAVFVRHNSKYVKIPMDSIVWIEAVGDYANINTETRRYTIHTTMKTLEGKLPMKEFMRVHRSYIVRLDSIQEIDENALTIRTGKSVPVGKSYRSKLLQVLNVI
jgi:DNA-binding LytR/AlgR family response regulator